LKRSVAIAQQYSDVIAVHIGNNQIRLAIAVEVTHSKGYRRGPDSVVQGWLESPVAVA
jgi:hypothetical protein